MIFFTADLHLSHRNIIKYCNRPFSSVEEMNNTIINNWNKKVNDNDTVYILGDLAFGRCNEELSVMKGEKILIIGDHDIDIDIRAGFRLQKFALLNAKFDGQYITLCHWCMRVWAKSHYNSWQLFGHSHGQLPSIGKSHDVGVDANNFSPLSLDEIIELMKNKPDNFNLIRRT